LYFCRKSLNL